MIILSLVVSRSSTENNNSIARNEKMALCLDDKIVIYADIYGIHEGSSFEVKETIANNTDSKFRLLFDKKLRIVNNKSTVQLKAITCAVCNSNIDNRIDSDFFLINGRKYTLRPNYLSNIDKVCREVNQESKGAINL